MAHSLLVPRVPPRWQTRAAFAAALALVAAAIVTGEAWTLPLALCAMSVLLVSDGVPLAWCGIATALGAPLALAAGSGAAYDGLILASLALWLLAFVTSWPHRGYARL